MKKKIVVLFTAIFLTALLLPSLSSAGDYQATWLDKDGNVIKTDTVHYEGLVPCGKDEDTLVLDDPNTPENEAESPAVTEPCQICHFFVMIDGIIDFLLVPCDSNHNVPIIPLIAVLMILIAGMMFYFGGSSDIAGAVGNPGMVEQAKMLLRTVAIGLIVIYGAWLIVDAFMGVIGVADWTGLKGGWWSINCNIKYKPGAAPALPHAGHDDAVNLCKTRCSSVDTSAANWGMSCKAILGGCIGDDAWSFSCNIVGPGLGTACECDESSVKFNETCHPPKTCINGSCL